MASALAREETRSAHAARDFREQRNDEWLQYLVLRQTAPGELHLEKRPVQFTRTDPRDRMTPDPS